MGQTRPWQVLDGTRRSLRLSLTPTLSRREREQATRHLLMDVLSTLLTGLAGASSLFLVAAGLTVIFGVTRVVNFSHGSLCMLGAYIGWSILTRLPRDPASFIARRAADGAGRGR